MVLALGQDAANLRKIPSKQKRTAVHVALFMAAGGREDRPKIGVRGDPKDAHGRDGLTPKAQSRGRIDAPADVLASIRFNVSRCAAVFPFFADLRVSVTVNSIAPREISSRAITHLMVSPSEASVVGAFPLNEGGGCRQVSLFNLTVGMVLSNCHNSSHLCRCFRFVSMHDGFDVALPICTPHQFLHHTFAVGPLLPTLEDTLADPAFRIFALYRERARNTMQEGLIAFDCQGRRKWAVALGILGVVHANRPAAVFHVIILLRHTAMRMTHDHPQKPVYDEVRHTVYVNNFRKAAVHMVPLTGPGGVPTGALPYPGKGPTPMVIAKRSTIPHQGAPGYFTFQEPLSPTLQATISLPAMEEAVPEDLVLFPEWPPNPITGDVDITPAVTAVFFPGIQSDPH
eukprot:gene1550-2824_t